MDPRFQITLSFEIMQLFLSIAVLSSFVVFYSHVGSCHECMIRCPRVSCTSPTSCDSMKRVLLLQFQQNPQVSLLLTWWFLAKKLEDSDWSSLCCKQTCLSQVLYLMGWEYWVMEGWCMSALSLPPPYGMRIRSDSPFKGNKHECG